jgi:hypothetical protein
MEDTKTEIGIDGYWLQSIFKDLMTLKESICLSRNGFKNLREVILFTVRGLSKKELYEVQLANLGLIITTFSTLLDDVRSQIDKDFYKETREILENAKRDLQTGTFHTLRIDQKNHKSWKTLSPSFFKMINTLDKYRGKLIQELQHILFVVSEGADISLSKSKPKTIK